MQEFRTKISENGRIHLPAACRELLAVSPGDEVVLRVEDHELHIVSLKYALQKAKSLVRKHAKNKKLTDLLKTMRSEDEHD